MPSVRAAIGPHTSMLDAFLIGIVGVLVAGTVASFAAPNLLVGVVNPSLDLVIHTVAAVVTTSVAVLALARFRQTGDPGAAFEGIAFTVLAIIAGVTVMLVGTSVDRRLTMPIELPDIVALYAMVLARTLAAALLVLGGIASLRGLRPARGLEVVLGVVVPAIVLLALFRVSGGGLPPLWTVAQAPIAPAPPISSWSLSPPTPLGATIQVTGAALFLWAAALSRRLYRRDGVTGAGYLAAGLVFAAFAQVQPAMYPGTYAGVVTTGDLLRVVFDVILLVGIQAQASAHLASLQRANEAMARSRDADAEHVALEERTRLSRELHDGLAQDLWVAKLKTRRLTSQSDLGVEARALAGELSEAIDAGLADAQQVVAAMRLPGQPAGSFVDLLSRYVDDFADRFGMRVEITCDEGLPPLPARAQAEALRIAREALTNAWRHADATVVRVRAGLEDGRLVVVVGDNGRGFDPATVGRSAFGLASMRERAAMIGAELRIDSRPHDGTRVSLLVPLAPRPVPVVAGRG